jgi:hypothetical protein
MFAGLWGPAGGDVVDVPSDIGLWSSSNGLNFFLACGGEAASVKSPKGLLAAVGDGYDCTCTASANGFRLFVDTPMGYDCSIIGNG